MCSLQILQNRLSLFISCETTYQVKHSVSVFVRIDINGENWSKDLLHTNSVYTEPPLTDLSLTSSISLFLGSVTWTMVGSTK